MNLKPNRKMISLTILKSIMKINKLKIKNFIISFKKKQLKLIEFKIILNN